MRPSHTLGQTHTAVLFERMQTDKTGGARRRDREKNTVNVGSWWGTKWRWPEGLALVMGLDPRLYNRAQSSYIQSSPLNLQKKKNFLKCPQQEIVSSGCKAGRVALYGKSTLAQLNCLPSTLV